MSRIPLAEPAPAFTDLLDFAHSAASDRTLMAKLPLEPGARTWFPLPAPGGAEAWVIGWPPGAETGWHDHGGSHGAFATAFGQLREHSLAVDLPTDGWRLMELADGVDRTRELLCGQGRAFGTHHVHQVVNPSPEQHAVSVHVYYPPLPLMRRYSRQGRVLRLTAVERPAEW